MKYIILVSLSFVFMSPVFAADPGLACTLQSSNPGTLRSYIAKLYSGKLKIDAAKENFQLDAVYYQFGRPAFHRVVSGRIRISGDSNFRLIELAAEKSVSSSLLKAEDSAEEMDTFPRTLGVLAINNHNASRVVSLNAGTGLGMNPSSTLEQDSTLSVSCLDGGLE